MRFVKLMTLVLLGASLAAPGLPGKGRLGQAPSAASDPAEPTLEVEAVSGTTGIISARRPPGTHQLRVSSGPRAPTLTVPAPHASNGLVRLTFRNAAPPMRFTLRLTGMPGCDLDTLRLSSGSLSLALGEVTTSATTRYFDPKGQPLDDTTGAAYTVTTRRKDNAEVDVQVRRGAGAAMGKTITVYWGTPTELEEKRQLKGG
jgi:hypothetical protein